MENNTMTVQKLIGSLLQEGELSLPVVVYSAEIDDYVEIENLELVELEEGTALSIIVSAT